MRPEFPPKGFGPFLHSVHGAMMATQASELIAIADLAIELQVNPTAAYHAARRLQIPMQRFGRALVVDRCHLAAIAAEVVAMFNDRSQP